MKKGRWVGTSTTYYQLEEVVKQNSLKELWLGTHGRLYNVPHFEETAGGVKVLLEQAGADATESSEDVGHSSDSGKMLKQYYIGAVHSSDLKPENCSRDPSKSDTCKSCWPY
ncbi:cytochrome b5 type B-like [Trachypithecus francoisi]|uniref:cytochrome b5 type B-like n=1 Tax=Trachypithecus francoisi TaxID=54180 RepID=UPI00141BD943|nr:cytochrome b5 type B-like [Trachypithecus francoisi]